MSVASHLIRPFSFIGIFNGAKMHNILDLANAVTELNANSSLDQVGQFVEQYQTLDLVMEFQTEQMYRTLFPELIDPVTAKMEELLGDSDDVSSLNMEDDATKNIVTHLTRAGHLAQQRFWGKVRTEVLNEVLKEFVDNVQQRDNTQCGAETDHDGQCSVSEENTLEESCNELHTAVAIWMDVHLSQVINENDFVNSLMKDMGWNTKKRLEIATMVLDVNREEALQHQFGFTLEALLDADEETRWQCQVTGREYLGDEIMMLYINNFRMMSNSADEYESLLQTARRTITDVQWGKLEGYGLDKYIKF